MNTTFESIHEKDILGKLTCVDRMIFNGYLNRFFNDGMAQYLSMQGVLLKDFGRYAEKVTDSIKEHALKIAADAGRPYIRLRKSMTRNTGGSKEDLARRIAEQDGIREGLICILGAVELRNSFDVAGNYETHKLEVRHRARPCLHLYFYFIDPDLGFMHIRLQAWFPFEIQVYVNGREWLCRQLDKRGVGYVRHDNTLLRLENIAETQELAETFATQNWPRRLNALAMRVNPYLRTILRAQWPGYYWVADECEVATDVMFKSRAQLTEIWPDLMAHAIRAFSAEDVMRFLGRKLTSNFQGEVVTKAQRRAEGWRVKHRMKRNWIKMYDKWSVLRVETTINNPSEFKVLRVVDTPEGRTRKWKPMGKGVANLWRYLQVGTQANLRYLEALAQVQPTAKAVQELDELCHGLINNGRRFGRFLPLTAGDTVLFKAALAGDHIIHGFRNRDITARLYPTPAVTVEERKRRCARVSRLIAKLRGHRLIGKVKDSRLYRVSPRGYRIMSAAIRIREADFPAAERMAS